MKTSVEVTSAPAEAELRFIGDSLAAFNEAHVGPAHRTPLAVLVRGEAGAIVAGISGYTAWGWLFIQWLWVDEKQRGNDMAARMLAAAEREAVNRGCHGAWIDTFNPTALKVYRRHGYEPFGALPDFPKGRDRVFLSKKL